VKPASTLFEWDPRKADANFKKHRIAFSEAEPVFSDEFALTIPDDESDEIERRFVTLGMGLKARVLVVVYCYRAEKIRIISARLAEPSERGVYEETR
jgi:hypothetical protein